MKIVVGMGDIDSYIPFSKRGADEVYIGYIPFEWYQKYGNTLPLNRREVRAVNVQIGTFSELQILSKMVKQYKTRVTITLNSLFYTPDCFDDIINIIKQCMSLGFCSFIVADSVLLYKIKKENLPGIDLHLSGEFGESNQYSAIFADKMNINRIIFNRKTPIEDMGEIIKQNNTNNLNINEYEAFALNEMCHFSGGFCNTLHCDEMCHACLLPYDINSGDIKKSQNDYIGLGDSGCGLCALYKLKKQGITHLKIVSRGADFENTLDDIVALKCAIDILNNSNTETEYINKMKSALFKKGCSNICYYKMG